MAGDPTCLVTGSTDGIGKATARQLAASGWRVILHGRNEGRARGAAQEVAASSGKEAIETVVADFASLRQVERMAEVVLDRYERLDLLVNNAGVYERERVLTQDGLETMFQVNFLAHFLLTGRLIGLLQDSARSRVVSLASVSHYSVHSVDFDNLRGQRYYDDYEAYATSKLAIVCFTYQLANRLDPSRTTANCLHPGVIQTKLLRTGFPGSTGHPPEYGADNVTYVATSRQLDGVTGTYFDEKTPTESSPISYDRELQQRLWRLAENLTGLSPLREPEVA